MPRPLVVLGLALLLVAALAPALETLAPCVEPCLDGAAEAGECGNDQCCSCCVHARFVEPDRTPTTDRVAPSSVIAPLAAVPPAAVDPRDILHVPKPAFA